MWFRLKLNDFTLQYTLTALILIKRFYKITTNIALIIFKSYGPNDKFRPMGPLVKALGLKLSRRNSIIQPCIYQILIELILSHILTTCESQAVKQYTFSVPI